MTRLPSVPVNPYSLLNERDGHHVPTREMSRMGRNLEMSFMGRQVGDAQLRMVLHVRCTVM